MKDLIYLKNEEKTYLYSQLLKKIIYWKTLIKLLQKCRKNQNYIKIKKEK